MLRSQHREIMAQPARAPAITKLTSAHGAAKGERRETRRNGRYAMRLFLTGLAAAGLWMSSALAAEAGTLDTIKSRGALMCGSNIGLAGFALPDDQGVYKG